MAAADLRRRAARRLRHPALDRGLQQGGERRDGDRALLRRPARPAGRALPRRAAGHPRRRAVGRRLHGLAGRRRGLRRLLPLRHALQPRRAGALRQLRAEGDLGGGLRRHRRDLARLGRLGPLQPRHHRAGQDPRRPAGQAHLHLPDRRPLPDPVRRGAGDAALGGRRGRHADRRARRHLVVRRDRDPLRRLVERADALPDQQHQRRAGSAATSSTPSAGPRCRIT